MKVSPRFKKTLHTKVINNIRHISPQEWNKVFPDALEGGYYFLKVLDESPVNQFTFCYILVYEGKQLAGAAPCFSMNYSLDTSVSGPLRRLTNSIKKIFPNLFNIKVFVCGIPTSRGNIGAIDNYAPAVLEALLRRMEQTARKKGAHILAFKDFGQSYAPLLDGLQKKGFIKIDSLPGTELPVNFSNFEEYLKRLSAATRYDLRRKLKKSSMVKIESTVSDTLDEKTLREAYQLYLQVVQTHEMSFEILPEDFFKLIAQNMPRQTKFFLWKIDGKLVAFLFCLVSDKLLIDCYLGLDYAVAHQYHLYFVKFKDVLDWCIAHGIKNYEMGHSNYEPKRRLGFHFVPLYLYVQIRHKALRPIFKSVCALLKFENFDPELKRWKNDENRRAFS